MFLIRNDLIDSKIYSADFDFNADWPNIINGFCAALIKLEISCFSSIISRIFSIFPFKDVYG